MEVEGLTLRLDFKAHRVVAACAADHPVDVLQLAALHAGLAAQPAKGDRFVSITEFLAVVAFAVAPAAVFEG